MTTDVCVVEALRTPIGTAGRSLAAVEAADLAAPVLSRLVADLGVRAPGLDVGEVLLGNCMGPGGDVARVATLAAGLDPETPGWGIGVPAVTVDRQCASGLAAVVMGAATVAASPGDVAVLAGGVESVSTAPWRSWPPGSEEHRRSGGGEAPARYERAAFAPAEIGDPEMGEANDRLAEAAGISRPAQDEYAARSHTRAVATRKEGGFDVEIVPVAGVDRDDRPRPGLTPERLARLRPAFREGGTITAGNSCGVNDGAAAVTLVSDDVRRGLGIPGLRIRGTATVALHPDRPGYGIVPATRLALERAGVTLDDIGVVELNEAFAGQVLACCRDLSLAPERVCPEGGALALGHPWGASGAVLMVRLFAQLVYAGSGGLGLAAIAAGGGQGVAVVVEAVL